jgi:hypothetical protein
MRLWWLLETSPPRRNAENYFKTPLPLNWNGFDFSRLASIATVPDAQIAF